MSKNRALNFVRASAIYDLVITFAFALPFTAKWLFDSLAELHQSLGLTGSLPDSGDAFVVMFANLMGGLVTVWAVYRIVRPSLAAGVADVGGRVFFSIGMLGALAAGASPLVAVMLAMEIVWAVLQGVAVVFAFRASKRAWVASSVGIVRSVAS
jgi:hypothetical protein